MTKVFVVTLTTDDPIRPTIEKSIIGNTLEVQMYGADSLYSDSLVIRRRDEGGDAFVEAIFPRERVIGLVTEEMVEPCCGTNKILSMLKKQ